MKVNKPWILRPVAWIATIAMVLALQLVAELVCKLGNFLVTELSGMSTLMIILCVMMFGSMYLSLFFYSAFLLPSFLVKLSDKIYPSNHAFRYYFCGLYEIVGSLILVAAGLMGAVQGGSMFWYYARWAWLILACIIMMGTGRGEAKERHGEL